MRNKILVTLALGVLTIGMVAISAAGTAGAQSVPIDQPPAASNPPASPVQPPTSPAELPTNGANVGGAGAAPARLPSAGTAGAGDSTTSLAFGALAVALAAGGVASWRLGRKVR